VTTGPAPVRLSADVQVLDGGRILLGGDPARVLRLSRDAPQLLARLARGLGTEREQRLGRTLVDGGLAHPLPPAAPVHDVEVVVPVRDRTAELDRCLTALGDAAPVVVVDDGSRDPGAVARVAARHDARVVRQDWTGPAGARNTGVAATRAGVVAFLDSDCTPPPHWLGGLLGHLADPAVAAVAPRVRSGDGASMLQRYARARGPLDLGPLPAQVRPGGRVPYVPTAALVVRRSALAGAGFDAALRYGEDVDLVWRLCAAGWTVRYDPRTVVEHGEPARWRQWLARRHRYGTSAAPLARRHPGHLAPLVVQPWLVSAWLLLAARRPVAALLAGSVPAARLHLVLRARGAVRIESATAAARTAGRGLRWAGAGLGGPGLVVTAPALAAAFAWPRTRRAGWLLLLAPPLLEVLERRPALDPVRWTALRLLDDLAYATGVWRGCWRERTVAPLRPRTTRRG